MTIGTARRHLTQRAISGARGAVLVEYIVLLAFVGMVLALTLAALGPRVVREYSSRRATLYSHSP